jgi:rhomboid protease GluP
MAITATIRENWLSRKPNEQAWPVAILSTAFLLVACAVYFRDLGGAREWMPASSAQVFQEIQLWRAWTTLFAHADFGHLIANMFLFSPLAYFLSGYFGWVLFPLLGILCGGLVNFVVLATLPAETRLIGISGVVYWMGSAWLTLSFLINRREKLRRRMGSALFLCLMLFVPEALKPEVSHLSHFVGWVFGLFVGLAWYFLHRRKFALAERTEYMIEDLDWHKDAENWQREATGPSDEPAISHAEMLSRVDAPPARE